MIDKGFKLMRLADTQTLGPGKLNSKTLKSKCKLKIQKHF